MDGGCGASGVGADGAPGGVTAGFVVLNWKRPGNVPQILDRVLSMRWVSSATVVDNGGSLHTPAIVRGKPVRMVRPEENLCTWGRFVGAASITEAHVLTCDDDWSPSEECLGRIWAAYIDAGCDCIVHALNRGHYENEGNGRRPWALLGWGAAFPRRSVEPAFRDWIDAYGEDELLRRKADRVFALLSGLAVRSIPAQGEQLPGATGAEALYRMLDHGRMTNDAVERAKSIVRSRRDRSCAVVPKT